MVSCASLTPMQALDHRLVSHSALVPQLCHLNGQATKNRYDLLLYTKRDIKGEIEAPSDMSKLHRLWPFQINCPCTHPPNNPSVPSNDLHKQKSVAHLRRNKSELDKKKYDHKTG